MEGWRYRDSGGVEVQGQWRGGGIGTVEGWRYRDSGGVEV